MKTFFNLYSVLRDLRVLRGEAAGRLPRSSVPSRCVRSDDGVVLIVVIGILAVLSLIAATFGVLMSIELAASRNQTEAEMARQAANAAADQLLGSLAATGATSPMPTFCPSGGQGAFGCRLLYTRDGLKVYYALDAHPGDANTAGLGYLDNGSFNINAMGHLNDLGSNSDYSIRYTSFDCSLTRLLEACFSDMSTADTAAVDTIRGGGIWAGNHSFANPDERRRVAILLSKAIISWRYGTDGYPGDVYNENDRMGHLPQWVTSLNWDVGSDDLGVGYPTAFVPPPSGAWGQYGLSDTLPSSLVMRTAAVTDQWSYAENGIWRTDTGGAVGAWNEDTGVLGSGIAWAHMSGIAEISTSPTYKYLITADTANYPGWHDWAPANRWAPGAAPYYYAYLATSPIKGPFQITANTATTLTFDTGAQRLTTLPVAKDSFCILKGTVYPRVGGGLDKRWTTAATNTGDTVPSAIYWPNGSVVTENKVDVLGVEYGEVLSAVNNPSPTVKANLQKKITAISPVWALSYWRDYYLSPNAMRMVVHITEGVGRGQVRHIVDNSSDTLQLDQEWAIPPGPGSKFVIEENDRLLQPPTYTATQRLFDSPAKFRPDDLRGDDRIYLSLGDLRDSVIVPALAKDGKDSSTWLGDTDARLMADVIMAPPSNAIGFPNFLSVSTRAIKGSQALCSINDWATDGMDNDGDGAIDEADEASATPQQIAVKLYEGLKLKDWAYSFPDSDAVRTAVRQAAQLVANIIDFRDTDSVPTHLTNTDLGETETFSVYGAEGVHVTEIMASPDDIVTIAGGEMDDDGNGNAPGAGWDFDTATVSFKYVDTTAGYSAHFKWTVPVEASGVFAIRLIGTGGPFAIDFGGGDTSSVSTPVTNIDPQFPTFNYGFARDNFGKLLAVNTTTPPLQFSVVAPYGSCFKGFALLPQYIELTNVAANDINCEAWTITTDRGAMVLPSGPAAKSWLKVIPGASADGRFPINYGQYVIAMSEAAYERQWSKAATKDMIWGDALGEDYPVFFAGDVNDDYAKAMMMACYDGATRLDPWVTVKDSAGSTIAGGHTADDAVDGLPQHIATSNQAYSSIEKTVMLQHTWLPTVGQFWALDTDAPTTLSGSQNRQITVQDDLPRVAAYTFNSNLNRQCTDIWDTTQSNPTLVAPDTDAARSIVYPLILNRPYPTIGWLGLVPTSNAAWRTIDPMPTPGGNVSATSAATTLPTYIDWSTAAVSPVNRRLKITAGAGLGQIRTVSAIDATPTTLDLTSSWTTLPDITSHFQFLPASPEELLGTVMSKASTGGVYARFNINSAQIEILKTVFDDHQAGLIVNTRNGIQTALTPPQDKNLKLWFSWDEVLASNIFQNASNDFVNPTGLGFFDDIASGIANNDSGAGLYADDFKDDSDEKEEWARRYANLFDLRSTAFRFIVAGLVYRQDATSNQAPIASSKIEMDVDMSSGTPKIVHFRYLTDPTGD